jgi:hypothetical protein
MSVIRWFVLRSILVTAVVVSGWMALSSVDTASGKTSSIRRAHTDGLAARDSVYSVLTYPRCINCHTATNYPQQGDQRRRHFANVIRGPEGIAARDHLTILDEPASHPHIETMMLANGDC